MNKIIPFIIVIILYVSIFIIDVDTIDRSEVYEFKIDIKGAVENEGIYTFKEGDMIIDALEECIVSKDADLSGINMSQKLYPEMVLVIPYYHGENLISINSANLEDLIKLPGIKDGLAKRIIDYRNNIGGFKELEEIKNVSGIGDKTFEKILPYICL